MIAVCELCPDRETAFRVPWDEAGAAMMLGHMREKHREDPRFKEMDGKR